MGGNCCTCCSTSPTGVSEKKSISGANIFGNSSFDRCHEQWWECVQGPLSLDMCDMFFDACMIIGDLVDNMTIQRL
jgi:hypothetical protein